jgi:hypothetical protein
MVIKMRQPYLRHALALPDAGTHIEAIDIQDPIVDFYIRMYAQNGATFNLRNYMKYVLDRIDVVDGSDVLFSLEAEEILALDFYHYKNPLEMGMDERPLAWQYCDFDIPLGLQRVNPVVAFDPTRFANPQIVLTWNLANIRATGVKGFVHDSLHVDIMADVIDKAPTKPSGYLMTKELYRYVTPPAGETRIDLPTDYAYRTLFLRTQMHCCAPDYCPETTLGIIEKARHDCDEQKYQPFEIQADDWKMWDKKWYGLWHQGYWFFTSGASTTWRDLNFRGNLSCAGSIVASAAVTTAVTPSVCQECTIVRGAGTNLPVHVTADGSLPCGTFAWPYGDADEPEEWLDIAEHKKSRLTVTHRAAGAIAQIFLTQYRTY